MLQDRQRICEGMAAALEDVLRSLNNLQERMHRGELFYACVGPRLVVTSACSVPVALLMSALALQVRRCAVAMLHVASVQSLLLGEPDVQFWSETSISLFHCPCAGKQNTGCMHERTLESNRGLLCIGYGEVQRCRIIAECGGEPRAFARCSIDICCAACCVWGCCAGPPPGFFGISE